MAARFHDTQPSADPVEEHINHFFDSLIGSLNLRRWVLLTKVRDIRQEMAVMTESRIRTERGLIEAKIEVEQGLQTAELREIQLELIGKLEEKLAEIRITQTKTRLVFRGEFEQLEQLTLNVGDVLKEELPVIPCYQHMMKNNVSISSVNTLSSPTAIAVDEFNGHIYVTEGLPARISVFTLSDHPSNPEYKVLEEMQYPYGIAVHRNKVYITDIQLHGVFYYKMKDNLPQFNCKLIGRGSGEKGFNYPRQLDVSTQGDLFIADYNNHRIQVLDGNLQYKRSITHEGMHRPRDVKIKDERLYVLTSDESPCVYMFYLNGDFVQQISLSQELKMSSASWFFYIDGHYNIIISDHATNRVRVYSHTGEHLHDIGEFQQGDYDSPLGIAIRNQTNLIVVAPYDESQIQVFS